MTKPTKRQLDFMLLAAELGRITSSDVHQRFGLKKTTAATLLGTAAKAGWLRCDDSQTQFKYFPLHDAAAVANIAKEAGMKLPDSAPPAPTTAQEPAPAQLPEAPAPAPVQSKIEMALSGLVEAIIDSVSDALTDRLEDIIANSMDKLADRMRTAPEVTPKAKTRKAVIVGLLPAQRNMIEGEFKCCYRFSFLDSSAPAQLVRSRIKGADDIFIMAEFINHSMTETINAAGRKPEIVRGGMTSLRESLTQIYVQQG